MNLDLTQAKAVEKLSRLKAGALFMKMGTGKTKTALDLARSRAPHFDTIIWIAPASLLADDEYKLEIDRWRRGLPIAFYSVEGISMSDTRFLEMRSLAEQRRVFCIVDETLTIKNTDAGRTRRLLDMWHLFDFRLILNGTPISKGLIDLYAQIQFIHPKILNMTETQFAHHFLQFKREGYKPWKRWSKPENEQALIEIIRPYIYDADLDIPVRLVTHRHDLRLTNQESADYREMKEDFLRDKFQVDFLSAAQKFQSFYTMAAAKAPMLDEIIRSARQRGEKTQIFVKFLHEIDALKERYKALEYSGRKKDPLSGLRGGADILISTYGTGSLGLNLQACNNVVFFSQTFDWAHKTHGLYRTYRTGQTRDVTVHDFWLDTGLERLMGESQNKKTNTAKNVNRLITLDEAMGL